jgi:hypothetical protein
MAEFTRPDTLGAGFSVEVRNLGVVVHHIRKRPDTGVFRYYRGEHNELTPTYENGDLEALKRRVQENPAAHPVVRCTQGASSNRGHRS